VPVSGRSRHYRFRFSLELLRLEVFPLDLLMKKPSSPQVRTTEGSALARGAGALVKYENSCHTRTLPPSTGGVNVRDNRSHDPGLSSHPQPRFEVFGARIPVAEYLEPREKGPRS